MTISVIIATYNGRHKIDNILSSLESQNIRDFELVVVVDGSSDGTAAFLQKRLSLLKELMVLEQVNKGRAGARNAAVPSDEPSTTTTSSK
ncbi:MAG: glycosyltransferase, partial [Imperialibacter sp.]|uniref:glycosyltransferase family 2 protein n=1 Tax=Imperialibacter sp. TaxID=2038411 RepID=UPI0032EEAAA7